MSTIYLPHELEFQALHGEEDQRRSSNQKSGQTVKDTISQSLYSSYRSIDRSRLPLPGSQRQEFGAFCCKGFADNEKKTNKKNQASAQRCYTGTGTQEQCWVLSPVGETDLAQLKFEASHL